MSIRMDDTGELDGAPRPIDMDSVAEGTFECLGEGQGAVTPRRAVAATGADKDDMPAISRRMVGALAAIAVLAVVVIVTLIIRALDRPVPNSEVPQQDKPVIEQTEVEAGDGISYRGRTYVIEDKGDRHELVSMPDTDGVPNSDQQSSLGELEGDPVGMVLFDATLVIPQNLANGTWKVVAYTIGSGWSDVNDIDGNAQTGEGVVSEAHLEGTNLVLVLDGSQVEVPLVW